jgi:hypothetical protein
MFGEIYKASNIFGVPPDTPLDRALEGFIATQEGLQRTGCVQCNTGQSIECPCLEGQQ